MPTITTRWANINDVALIVPLFDGYRQFYEKPSDLELCTQFITARLQNAQSKIILAFDVNGNAVGFSQLYPLFSSLAPNIESAHVWLLNDLYVSEFARGLGAGKALLDFVQNFAALTHAGYLMLETAKTNKVAQSLYEKQGWQRDNEFLVYSWRA
jgi:ribosomal protein S18 acetylase RimI-like enzyme